MSDPIQRGLQRPLIFCSIKSPSQCESRSCLCLYIQLRNWFQKPRQWKARSCSPRETIEKPVTVNLHHTRCSATTVHTPAKKHVLRSRELVHVHRAAPQPCSHDSEPPCTGSWHSFPDFQKNTAWLLSRQLLPQPFYRRSHKCLQLTLNPLEISGPEINLVLRYPRTFGSGWWS